MTDLLADLNASQREAVVHIDGPLLVLAGAGSGKTRVITRRVAYLIARGVDPRGVLAITFTNKAAEEMRQRVSDLRTPPGATVCTFHSLCAKLLREHAPQAGLRSNFTIYDRDDQLKITKTVLQQLNLAGSYLTPARVHAAISNAKNDLQTPEAFANQAADHFARCVAEVYPKYEQLLAENNALDFDDLLLRMAFLLRDQPRVRRALGDRYRYVLIDEYQDTNHAQYILAHAVALDHTNLCVTGDPDQSIYAWRGADIHNILDFEKDYPNARVIRLEENYRSVQPILTAASRLIEHNTFRKSKGLFTSKTGGEKVRVLLVDDEHAEARQVARRIEDDRIAGRRYGDVAIFYRVNSLSRVLEEALLHAGVPYRIARGVEFYNRKEIKDVLAYAKLLVNPADDLCCARIINTPARGIGATTLRRMGLFAADRGLSLLDAARRVEEVGLSAGTTKKVRAFAETMTAISANAYGNQIDRGAGILPAKTVGYNEGKMPAPHISHRPVREILEDVLHRTGLEKMFGKDDEDARQARANVDELITSAAEFDEEDHAQPLADYVQQISLVSDADHFDGATGAVTLMTLHAAKGLEFPAVYIVGCEEELLPWNAAGRGPGEGEDLQKLEEERRLAFVGMTRAKERLILTSARSRRLRGQQQAQAASRFLQELGDETVETIDWTTHRPRPGAHRRRGGFYDEPAIRRSRRTVETFSEEEDPISSQEETGFPPEYEHLRPGCRVHHAKFGIGKLVKLSQRWPETRAEVLFGEYGRKRLVLRHTHLELMDEGF